MRTRVSRAVGIICGACLVAAFGAIGPNQAVFAEKPEQPQSRFYAPLDVPLVNVDVYVTDDMGRPVSGLGASDFRVFEDGKPVEISHFYAAPGVAIPTGQPVSEDAGTEASTEPIQDLFLVIFIDDTNLSRGRRQAAIKYIGDFFSSDLPEGLRVMLVSYDGRLQVVQALTDDLSLISDALNSAASMASLSRRDEEDRLIRDMENAQTIAFSEGSNQENVLQTYGAALFQEIQSYSDQVYQRSRTGLHNLTKLVRSMSGLPGRKAMLLISDGVEPRPGERLYAAWGQIFGSESIFETEAKMSFFRATQNDLSNEFTDLAHYANSHRVTLYTLGSLADGQLAAMSAERRRLDEGRLLTLQNMSEDVMASSMADSTGGRPLANSPALGGQLAEIAHELTSYYSLAYRPDHVGDGAYHRIKVEVPGTVYELRYRTGYNDIPVAERINDQTLAAAIHGVGDNKMGIAVKAFETTRREDGAFLVPLIVVVPVSELILLPAEDEHRGQISIILAVRDERGGLSEIQRREYPIVVPNDRLVESIGKTAGFTMRLAVRGGKQRIAVSVLDEIARTESVTTIDLDIPGTDG